MLFGPAAILGSLLAVVGVLPAHAAFLCGLLVMPLLVVFGICLHGAQAEANDAVRADARDTQLFLTTVGLWFGTWCLIGVKANSGGPVALSVGLLLVGIACLLVGLRPAHGRLSEVQ